MSDTIIPLIPTTDFHKLLFAKRLIKEQAIAMGKLKSMVHELQDQLIKINKTQEKWTAEEKRMVKSDQRVVELTCRNTKIASENKRLHRTNNELVAQVIKLRDADTKE